MARGLSLWTVLLWFTAAGCGDGSPRGGPDAGQDAWVARDSGRDDASAVGDGGLDAGSLVDGGGSMDAGVAMDAGATVDAGAAVDGGLDAGTAPDAGASMDSGWYPDTGPPELCDSPPAPCGGAVEGLWTFESTCYDAEPGRIPDCLEAWHWSTWDFVGTADFMDGGTVRTDGTVTQREIFLYPPSCLVGLSECSEYDFYPDAVCTGDVSVECTCVDEETGSDVYDAPWSYLSSTTLSLDGIVWSYCVDGMRLWLMKDWPGAGSRVYTLVR